MANRSRDFIVAVSLLLTSLLVAGVLAEVLLRALGYQGEPRLDLSTVITARDDAVLDWRYAPGVIRRGAITYRYNSLGHRDRERSLVPDVGSTRVAVVGDSVTDGYGVAHEQMFSSVLQELLGEEFEVLNFAQGGTNGPQVMRILELDALAFAPQYVIYNLVLNGCAFFSRRTSLTAYQDKQDAKIDLLGIRVNPEFKRWLKSSAVIFFLKEHLATLKALVTGIERPNYFRDLWANPQCKERIAETLDLFAAKAKESQFTPLVLLWPVISPYKEYYLYAEHQWIAEQAKKRGIAVRDLLPAFSEYAHTQLRISPEDAVHPNARGHSIAAQQAYDWLKGE